MEWTLVGQADSKRTSYFLKAASELGYPVSFVEIEEYNASKLAGTIVKVDPPTYHTSDITQLPLLTERYIRFLKTLDAAQGLTFLNYPSDILATLDKRHCKQVLLKAGIPTTPMLSSAISCYEELVAEMRAQRAYQVFVKPNNGSGAAGVSAFRLNPKQNEVVMYTSVLADGSGFFNTKRMKRITSATQAAAIVNQVLKQGAIVEEWIPKATHNGAGYDLRVVWQFGKVAFIVPRFSKSPITNLHLNNMAGIFDDLRLNSSTISKIDLICSNTMKLFPRLSYAGIDILLTKDSLQPMVIEVNGQGDLIYQDIYAENTIYKQQLNEGEYFLLKRKHTETNIHE